MPVDLRARLGQVRWPTLAWVVGLLAAVPLVAAGPGNDLDVANVYRSGRAIARHFSYVPSRPPGAPIHEGITGVLDIFGGPVLVNLASVAAAAWLVIGLDRLLEEAGHGPTRRLAIALVAANPWFVIAATSSTEYVLALAFVVAAARAVRQQAWVLAGLLAAGAMGCRVGSITLLAGVLVAELTGRATVATARSDLSHKAPRPWRGLAAAGVVAAIATVALFVPAALSSGGLSFTENDFSTSSVPVQIGRALAKDLLLLGPVATLVALVAIPGIVLALRQWQTSWTVRFAVVGFVLSQLLFVRFPWKMPHLLPTLLCLAVLLATALDARPRVLVALVALQLAFCVVRVDVVQPDDPNRAGGGRVHLSAGWGPVVQDWRCRREHPEVHRGRQKVEVEDAWNCAKPFGG